MGLQVYKFTLAVAAEKNATFTTVKGNELYRELVS